MADETLRPWRAQLDDRQPPARRVPFALLRRAYEHAADTQRDNADQPETVRDYWPSCVDMAFEDAGVERPT